jgi:hypothetical protein
MSHEYDWKYFLVALLLSPLRLKPVFWLFRLLIRPVVFIPVLIVLGVIIGVLVVK